MYHLETKIKGQGENITLNNTAETPFEVFKVTGNSVQESRSGKNLVNINSNDIVNSNIAANVDNNSLILEGDTTGNFYCAIPINLKTNTNYYISFLATIIEQNNLELSPYVRVRTDLSGSWIGSSIVINKDLTTQQSLEGSFNSGDNTTAYLILYLNAVNDGTQRSAKIKFDNLQVEEGTQATDYEQYGASPSPEYPSEIQNVEGNVNVSVCNKNIYENIEDGYINTTTGNNQSSSIYKRSIGSILLKANKQLKLIRYDENKGIRFYYYDLNGNYIESSVDSKVSELNTKIYNKDLLLRYVLMNTTSAEDVKCMLCDVNSTSNYIEHQEQIVNFPLAQGQKLMKGDYLAADGIHHIRKQIELDGTENIAVYNRDYDMGYGYRIPILSEVKPNSSLLCTKYKYIPFADFYNVNTDIGEKCSTHDTTGAYVYFGSSKATVEEFKQEIAGSILEYELAEEEIEPYTEEQQEAYNQINSLYSYDEVTNIFSSNEISPIFDVGTFKMITEEFKQRLLNGKITRAYLKVLATDTKPEIIINESNYLKDLTFEELRYVPEEGFIGGTVAKRVTGNFNNVDSSFTIQDREFELYMGVDLEDETTEYIKYGTYIVQKPEDDQVNDNTSFEALDYMIKLNLPWVDRMTYPCTLKELFDDLVAQSGLSTKVTSFLNQDFIVENNQFEEGTTRRDVLKAIAQMAFNWARIDEDNDIVMDFEKKDEVAETLTADNYYNFKKQDMYGPINVIVLRNSQVEGENITIRDEESIAQYGETELVISDNPFAYTQAKRAELIEAGRILFGLTYIPMSMDMIGYMYLNCKDKIKATNLNNETFETYLLNHTIEYAGTISDSMEAPASTKTETQYQFTPPMIEALKHTELLVDKANQRIDAVIKNISDTNEKMVEIEATLEGVTSTVSEVVKKTNETSEKVDNLKSGANNLIVNSGYFNNTDGWKANGDGITLSVENFDGFNCIKATGSIVYAYDELPLYNAGFIRLEPNSTYIIQLEMYLYRELAEGETDITYPITNSNPLHTYINSMKSTGVVMSGNSAIDSENGASVKKTLLSSSSYKTNEWVKIQLKIETGNPTLDYPYYAIKPYIYNTSSGIGVEGNIVYMKNIYVKQTNIISDWSPSQNDIVNDLDENYYTKSETQSQIKQTSDSLTSQISNIESEISSTNGDVIGIKTQISEVQQKLDGLTTNITSTGGNNLFRNSVGYFGSDFWTGELKSYTSTEVKNNSVSGNAIMLQNSNLSQTVFVKNGYYNISFIYKKLIELALCKIRINGYEIELTELDITEFERNFQVTDNTITFEIISDTNDACYISDLLLIAGQYKQTWTQNQNETVTDTVRIGQGIEVVSSKTNTKLLADSDGVRINNVLNNNTIAEFTDKGTTTENLIVNETAQIAGLLIQKIGEQVCFNVL